MRQAAAAALADVSPDEIGDPEVRQRLERAFEQYLASETDPIPAMHTLMDWLPANTPADDGQVSLIHGDYRLDNMIFHPEREQVVALLDWELSTLGHPYADLAYQCMQWRLPAGPGVSGWCFQMGTSCGRSRTGDP